MGQVKCEITTNRYSNGAVSDGFTVEVRSKDGKIYQKRSSFMNIPFLPNMPGYTYDDSIIKSNNKYEMPVKVLIYVDYGDVITATRGSGSICLKDESATEFSGKSHLLSVKPDPTDSRVVQEVKVTKENVRVSPHKLLKEKVKKEYRPSKSVWDA